MDMLEYFALQEKEEDNKYSRTISLKNAIYSGDLAIVKYLVEEKKLDIEEAECYGAIVHIAVELGQLEILKYLVKTCPNILLPKQDMCENYGVTLEVAKLLVGEKSNIDIKLEIDSCIARGNMKLANTLIKLEKESR